MADQERRFIFLQNIKFWKTYRKISLVYYFNFFFPLSFCRIGKHKCIICGEAFYQKDMLKRHVLSFHNEVTSFRGRSITSKNSISKSQSQQQISSTKSSNKAGYKRTMECPNLLKYNSNVTLSPGTLMTVFKCPVEGCNKKSCTDIKSFKLHCMHIHQVNMLPLNTVSDEKKIWYILTISDT